MTTFRKSSW